MAVDVPTSEFESELERARARWVRRRFLWLMGFTLVLSVPLLPASWVAMEFGPDRSPSQRAAGMVRFGWATFAVLLYLVCTMAVLLYRNRRGWTLFPSRLALALMALTGLLTVPVERVAAGLEGTVQLNAERRQTGTTQPSKGQSSASSIASEFFAGFEAGSALGEQTRRSAQERMGERPSPTRAAATLPALTANERAPSTQPGGENKPAAIGDAESHRLTLRPGFEIGFGPPDEKGDRTTNITLGAPRPNAPPAPPPGVIRGPPSSALGGGRLAEQFFATVWSPGLRTALMAIRVAISVHLLSCLFMPWTVGESLIPAGAILGSFAAVAALDLLIGQITLFWLALIVPVLLAALVPGTALCWWRYSRFRGEYRLQFESDRYQELRGEMAEARKIHDSCLPPQLTDGPVRVIYAYRPMRDIGGDLLVNREQPGGRRLAVVIDVTGHGITAALTVNRLLGELDRILGQQQEPTPAATLAALNRYTRLMLSHHALYLSAVVLVVDPTSRTLTYASGGHPTGHICRIDGTIEDLESTSTLLGVLPPEQYDAEERVLTLEPGEVVLFCTDGATESRQPDGSLLRTSGMRALFSEVARSPGMVPDRVADALMLRLEALRPGEAEDDTLLVCVYLPR